MKIGKKRKRKQKRYIKGDSLLPPDKYKQFESLDNFSSASVTKNTLHLIDHPLSDTQKY